MYTDRIDNLVSTLDESALAELLRCAARKGIDTSAAFAEAAGLDGVSRATVCWYARVIADIARAFYARIDSEHWDADALRADLEQTLQDHDLVTTSKSLARLVALASTRTAHAVFAEGIDLDEHETAFVTMRCDVLEAMEQIAIADGSTLADRLLDAVPDRKFNVRTHARLAREYRRRIDKLIEECPAQAVNKDLYEQFARNSRLGYLRQITKTKLHTLLSGPVLLWQNAEHPNEVSVWCPTSHGSTRTSLYASEVLFLS